MSQTKKILFISRAYPPVLGGIENQNYGIAKALSKIAETDIVANKRGKKNLPLFLPWAFLKATFVFRKYDAVLLGDGVLSPLGAWLKFLYPRKRAVSIVHGLDITFAYKKSLLGKIYRFVNIPALKNLDKLIMVGHETIRQAMKFGIPEDKCVFIPNGLEPETIVGKHDREELEKLLGFDISGKKIIFRGGRYVKHKGLEWFIRKVMPKLPENYILVAAGGGVASATAGDGNMFPLCQKAVEDLGLQNRVKMFVNIPQPDLEVLFNTCDVYVSPNIKVPGSMEGFGITAIEAAACERVVLASNLEGLKDAVSDGESGFLVEPGNAEAWSEKIKEVLADDVWRVDFGRKAAEYVRDNFTWEKISRRYLEEIRQVLNKL